MGLDIRLPIGLMFVVLGAMLAAFGLYLQMHSPEVFKNINDLNIDLWWGLVLLGFGGIMLALARRGTSAMHSAPPEPNPEASRPH